MFAANVATLQGHQPNDRVSGILSAVPSTSLNRPASFMNLPSYVQSGRLRFLILDAPHHDNIGAYIEELKNHGVTDLVRTCEPTYDDSVLVDSGVTPHALVFPDGEPPSTTIIRNWLELVEDASHRNTAVGVHCLAGLGRAPVLVVIALIESGHMKNIEAIELVRSKRRGAINRRQLEYLMVYKKQRPMSTKSCCAWFC